MCLPRFKAGQQLYHVVILATIKDFSDNNRLSIMTIALIFKLDQTSTLLKLVKGDNYGANSRP